MTRVLGMLMLLMSASMIFSVGWAVYDYFYFDSPWRVGSEVFRAFAAAMGIGAAAGAGLYAVGHGVKEHLGKREALLIVSLSWFVGAALAALPFWLWAQYHSFTAGQDMGFYSFVNCYFEAMSGLTTTGATILQQIETIPRSLLFWRAFTHWLGGLGIVVLFVAVLPSLGAGTKRLVRLESTGISSDGVTPHMQESARSVLIIYLSFTVAQVILMKLVGTQTTWFSAIAHTFATLATGGYSTFNASAGALGPADQWIIFVFMLLAGVNFGLYGPLLKGKTQQFFLDNELRAYLTIIAVGTIAVFASIYGTQYHTTTGDIAPSTFLQTFRDSAFQVVSIMTTTGFATVNFEEWSIIPQGVLILLMFVGGCGGSTGGGIKVIRILGAIKIMWVELERSFRPNVIRPCRVGTHSIDHYHRVGILAYVLGIIVLFAVGAMALMLTESSELMDGTTALTASIATLNNVGPGFSRVGAIENYHWFSDAGKMIMCVLMALGRLEVFSVLVIFMPRFWRSH